MLRNKNGIGVFSCLNFVVRAPIPVRMAFAWIDFLGSFQHSKPSIEGDNWRHLKWFKSRLHPALVGGKNEKVQSRAHRRNEHVRDPKYLSYGEICITLVWLSGSANNG